MLPPSEKTAFSRLLTAAEQCLPRGTGVAGSTENEERTDCNRAPWRDGGYGDGLGHAISPAQARHWLLSGAVCVEGRSGVLVSLEKSEDPRPVFPEHLDSGKL